MTVKQAQQSTRIWWVIVVGMIVAAALLIVALQSWNNSTSTPVTTQSGGSSAVDAGAETQVSEGGQVTVNVTRQDAQDGLSFTVVMDTHAVDLDGYDLAALAVLRTADGQELRPRTWDAPKGGHHREGTLTFPATNASGPIELVIREIGGVPERIFQWP
jgi:hypothetical protein